MRKSMAVAVATVVAGLVTACSGSTTVSAPTASSTSSTTTPSGSTAAGAPTAEQAAWAGQVCTATSAVEKDVEGLAAAATSGGDVSAKLTAQLGVVKASASTLATTIKAVPPGSESDPELAAVKASADEFSVSLDSLASSVTALEGQSGASLVSGLQSVATAAGTAVSKLGATAQVIGTAAKDGKSVLGQAFASAPSCASLEAS